MPECLEENIKKTGASYGTLMHNILMCIDYSKINNYNDLKEFIQTLIDNKVILSKDINSNMINNINTFLNSKIGRELKEASEIYKEKEFILRDLNISNSDIQGIIDLYYINNNKNITLVDFKTDGLTNESEFIEKYKTQLDIYKIALEKLTGRVVEKTYIYSFKLGKEIEVK